MLDLQRVAQTLGANKDEVTKKLAPKRSCTKDRHKKVDGRGRRIRMPAICAARIFQLTRELGHKSDGESIQWLLQQAEPSIVAATGSGTIPASALAAAGASVSCQQGNSSASSCLLHNFGAASSSDWNGTSPVVTNGLWPSFTGYGSIYGNDNSNLISRFGLEGYEFQNSSLNQASLSAFLGGVSQQVPGLELGLSHEVHTHSGADANAMSHFFQQIGQEGGGAPSDPLNQQHLDHEDHLDHEQTQ